MPIAYESGGTNGMKSGAERRKKEADRPPLYACDASHFVSQHSPSVLDYLEALPALQDCVVVVDHLYIRRLS